MTDFSTSTPGHSRSLKFWLGLGAAFVVVGFILSVDSTNLFKGSLREIEDQLGQAESNVREAQRAYDTAVQTHAVLRDQDLPRALTARDEAEAVARVEEQEARDTLAQYDIPALQAEAERLAAEQQRIAIENTAPVEEARQARIAYQQAGEDFDAAGQIAGEANAAYTAANNEFIRLANLPFRTDEEVEQMNSLRDQLGPLQAVADEKYQLSRIAEERWYAARDASWAADERGGRAQGLINNSISYAADARIALEQAQNAITASQQQADAARTRAQEAARQFEEKQAEADTAASRVEETRQALEEARAEIARLEGERDRESAAEAEANRQAEEEAAAREARQQAALQEFQARDAERVALEEAAREAEAEVQRLEARANVGDENAAVKLEEARRVVEQATADAEAARQVSAAALKRFERIINEEPRAEIKVIADEAAAPAPAEEVRRNAVVVEEAPRAEPAPAAPIVVPAPEVIAVAPAGGGGGGGGGGGTPTLIQPTKIQVNKNIAAEKKIPVSTKSNTSPAAIKKLEATIKSLEKKLTKEKSSAKKKDIKKEIASLKKQLKTNKKVALKTKKGKTKLLKGSLGDIFQGEFGEWDAGSILFAAGIIVLVAGSIYFIRRKKPILRDH